MPPKEKVGVVRGSKVFFPPPIVAVNHVVPPGIWPGFRSPRFSIVSSSFPINEKDVNIVCIDNCGFNSEESSVTHYKRLPGHVTEWGSQWLPSMGINMTTTRSTIFVLPQTLRFADEKTSEIERKSFTRRNSPDSKVFGFKVPTLNSGFKVSGNMTNGGVFILDSSTYV